jgi:ArsR family transcriptional regulator
MDEQYKEYARLFKALSDPNRLMIVDMLSCGELCACFILEKFKITQPTLSHHMKILVGNGIVDVRKKGKWMYYCIDVEGCEKAMLFLRKFAEVAAGETNTRKEECCR